MSGPFGVTPQGFLPKTAVLLKSEIEATLMAGPLGKSAGTEPDGSIPPGTIAGQLVALFVEPLSALWDVQQATYSSGDPGQAVDAAQDAICSITGTLREGPLFSTASATCCGTPGTLLAVGRGAAVIDANTGNPTGVKFASTTAASILAVAAWPAAIAVVLGQRCYNDTPHRVYQCVVPGVTAGAGGPTGAGTFILDGGARWNYIGLGQGAVDVPFKATVVGQLGALAGSLRSITTPIAGWFTVTNQIDATVGRLLETNTALRQRREVELVPRGNSIAAAIRARVLKVGLKVNNPVVSCRVFSNNTDAVNGDGMPPHSVEVLALGGPDDTTPAGQTGDPTASVAAAVFDSVAAGIQTVNSGGGAVTVNVVDDQGNAQVVKFTRPVQVPIWIAVTVYYDPTKWPLVGAAALVTAATKSAILTYGLSYFVGESVRSSPIAASVIDGLSATDSTGVAIVPAPPGSVPAPGIVDVTPCFINTAFPAIASTPIVIGSRQIAVLDSGRISVTPIAQAP